jgi:quinohemoprotein ethanol dehydrogenase
MGSFPSARIRFAAAQAVAASIAAAGLAQPGYGAPRDGDGGLSTADLAALPTVDWPTNGGNLFNQRYSPLKEIDRSNVAGLKGVWRARLGGSGTGQQYSGEAQIVVYDDTAYVSTGADDVFAISLATGEIVWQYEAKLDPGITSVCCGWTSRGVAVSTDRVFVGRLDARLVALDRATGKPVWDIVAERWEENFSITSAPLYYDGMVITGFAGADRGTRGRLKAYDADDGRLLWTFYTIPGPGEKGHETWPQDNDSWKYGGGSIWQTPAVDPELGMVYFSTGNAGPDYNGAVRPGDNLYTSSIVAIDAATGEYRWHFQQVHHDIWDYDSPNPVVLMDLTVGGRERKALVEVGKTGWAYILDRENGRPLIGIDEKPVPQEPLQATAATQPFPRGDAIIPHGVEIAPEGMTLVNGGRIFTPFVGDDATIVKPGVWGGANWPPSSYDPVQQTLFVCASSVAGTFAGGGNPTFMPPQQGQRFAGGGANGGGFTRLARTGIFAALDMTSNKLVWRFRWPEQCYSGSMATAGGLIFVGRNDGRLTALDSRTGMQLWEFQTGAGMHAGVSSVERNGRQYVLAYSAGNALIGSARGDSVWLFGLDGTLPPVEAGAPLRRTPDNLRDAAAGPATTATADGPADLAQGKRVFQDSCVICHGEDGRGGHGGGAPLDAVASLGAVIETVDAGRNSMPAFRDILSPEQIRDVAGYVVEGLAGARAP